MNLVIENKIFALGGSMLNHALTFLVDTPFKKYIYKVVLAIYFASKYYLRFLIVLTFDPIHILYFKRLLLCIHKEKYIHMGSC